MKHKTQQTNYPAPLLDVREYFKEEQKESLKLDGEKLSVDDLIDFYLDAKYYDDLEQASSDIQLFNFTKNKLNVEKVILKMEFKEKIIPSYYFINSELKPFLEKTKINDDFEPIIKTIKETGIKADSLSGRVSCFFMHLRFPDLPCFTCCLIVNRNFNNKLTIYVIDGKNNREFFCLDALYALNSKNNQDAIPYLALVINFFYYLKAFPDAVSEGKPVGKSKNTGVREPNIFTVQTDDSIVEYRSNLLDRGRVTHFRKGHFRFLGSDYFVNRKGDCVFIHDTLVHGRAANTVC